MGLPFPTQLPSFASTSVWDHYSGDGIPGAVPHKEFFKGYNGCKSDVLQRPLGLEWTT